jgi:hypothetical protein
VYHFTTPPKPPRRHSFIDDGTGADHAGAPPRADERMQAPNVHGIIRRRVLVNFRVDGEVMQRFLPPPFRPRLHEGQAIAGICLIRLEEIRPKRFPTLVGISSENAAHRIAVVWDEQDTEREGVYIPRRDTGSMINHLVGGRLFPGEHHRATFNVKDDGDHIDLSMRSLDGVTEVRFTGARSEKLPAGSSFRSVDEASRFFERGSLGYSATARGRRLDGLMLKTEAWRVDPFELSAVYSSFFSDRAIFPDGSVQFDCALIMRNIAHEWLAVPGLQRT